MGTRPAAWAALSWRDRRRLLCCGLVLAMCTPALPDGLYPQPALSKRCPATLRHTPPVHRNWLVSTPSNLHASQ